MINILRPLGLNKCITIAMRREIFSENTNICWYIPAHKNNHYFIQETTSTPFGKSEKFRQFNIRGPVGLIRRVNDIHNRSITVGDNETLQQYLPDNFQLVGEGYVENHRKSKGHAWRQVLGKDIDFSQYECLNPNKHKTPEKDLVQALGFLDKLKHFVSGDMYFEFDLIRATPNAQIPNSYLNVVGYYGFEGFGTIWSDDEDSYRLSNVETLKDKIKCNPNIDCKKDLFIRVPPALPATLKMATNSYVLKFPDGEIRLVTDLTDLNESEFIHFKEDGVTCIHGAQLLAIVFTRRKGLGITLNLSSDELIKTILPNAIVIKSPKITREIAIKELVGHAHKPTFVLWVKDDGYAVYFKLNDGFSYNDLEQLLVEYEEENNDRNRGNEQFS